jgi:branched-chain amino acid transport system substrate-binding protein
MPSPTLPLIPSSVSLKRLLTAIVVALAAFMARPTSAEDTYQVGVTGALKGRSAASYAPVVEALRLYIDKVNAAGGVNGKPVNLLIEDDLIFAGSVCPKYIYPPAAEDAFCTNAFAATYDSRAALSFVHEAAAEPVKIAFVAMAIPLSRMEIDFAAGEAPRLGMTVVYKEGILPPTEDYTPFANGIKDAGANWVYSWAPWVTQIRTYEALRQIGWSGSYITWAHTEAEAELERIKDPNLYVIGANALFADALPIQKEVVTAMNEAGSKYRPEQMTEGWIAGMTVEAALKAAGADATPAKVRAALQNLKVDVQGLRGGPIEWTRENHFRLKQYYRVYHWDGAKIAPVKDWFAYEVK